MDSLIRRFDAVIDDDLVICESRGVAYQRNMRATTGYDGIYLQKIEAYDKKIAAKVNAGRVALLAHHLPEWEPDRVHRTAKVLDVGAGDLSFLRTAEAAGYRMCGYDVIPEVRAALIREGKFSEGLDGFQAVTLWDTIEHLESPERWLRLAKGAFLFISVPVFENLHRIRESKHYRPGEHLYYWTAQGFVDYMAMRGFRLLEGSMHEIDAGRENIGAFAFCKDLPDYRAHVSAYNEIHSTRHYGDSATDEYLPIVAAVVKERNPRTILDYGCGRSDIAAHFWRDGERTIMRYDPAIPKYKLMPEGRYDLMLCLDVMEHIPISGVDRVLSELRAKGDVCIFAISTILARAKLPDGRNAHVTILTKGEWQRWITEAFGGAARVLPAKHKHELVLLAGVR